MIILDVIIPTADKVYSYTCSEVEAASATPGARVCVHLGRGEGRRAVGIVLRARPTDVNPDVRLRKIDSVIDRVPIVTQMQLEMWHFVASYYLSSYNDIARAALPAAFRATGDDDEERVDYRPLYINFLCKTGEDVKLTTAKQRAAMVQFNANAQDGRMLKSDFLRCDFVTPAVLATLVRKGVLRIEKQTLSRLDLFTSPQPETIYLTEAQRAALEQIEEQFATHATVLLHGPSASGKTEVYTRLIEHALARGEKSLLLLPENKIAQNIALRLKRRFGSQIGLWFSDLTVDQRAEFYLKQTSDEPYNIILGVRSAIFLPFKELSLVVVDEESDAGYKVIDPSPRINARDAAIFLAHIHGAKTLLSSAIPSFETYANVRSGKYGCARLSSRYHEGARPEISVINLEKARENGKMRGALSFELIAKINKALDAERRVILFQNKSGFASSIQCAHCGCTPKCPQCDVVLSTNKMRQTLRCRLCSHTEPIPERCPQCGSIDFSGFGAGTEKIEMQVEQLFPAAKVHRVDADVSSSKQFNKIIEEFESGAIDILIGTSAIARGIDFSDVALVGIINADALLYGNDFRANERAYQMFEQLIGRAGRKGGASEVILQTSKPSNPIFGYIVNNDYESFYNDGLIERYRFNYPPYMRLIKLIIKHKSNEACAIAASDLAMSLRKRFGNRVLGPSQPDIEKARGVYRRDIILKIEVKADIVRAKKILDEELAAWRERNKSATVVPDVDPIYI